MVRKLSLAIAIALGVTPWSVNALGLGDIHTKSALNQYFKADIELLSVAKDELEDVTVELASVTAFKKAGVERPYFLSKLNFSPMQLPDGSTIIRVSSSDPIREPFLDFVIEVNWPKGRLLREYTVLLDPPVTLERRPAPIQQAGTQATRSARSESSSPVAGVPVAGARDYSWAEEGSASEYGPTRRNDTLWGIAEQVRYRGITQEQMMMSLFRENPHAFVANNVNNLRKGEILRVPSRDQVMKLDAREARTAFWNQMNVWRADQSEASAAPPQTAAIGEGVEGQSATADTEAGTIRPEAELKIATARPEGIGEAGPGESNEPTQIVSKLQQDLVAAEEARESAITEGKELQSRVQDLESQLEDLQRLLTLKSEQLARLQVAAASDEETVAASDEETVAASDEETVAASDEETVAASDEETVAAPDEETVAVIEEELVTLEEGEQIGEAEPMALQEDTLLEETTEQPGLSDETGLTGVETTESEELLVATEETVAEDPTETEMVAESEVADATEQAATETTEMEATEPVSEELPVATAKPATPEKRNFLQMLATDTTMMGIAVAVVVVLLALMWAVVSRRKSASAEFQESILVNTMDREDSEQAMEGTEPVSQTTEETSFLSDFSPSDIDSLQDETGEVDPVAEADVYIAYGRYNQAEELIRQALEKDPQRSELKQKLFEIMFATKDAEGYTALAEEAAGDGMQQKDPVGWEKVISMGMKLAPTAALFTAAAVGETQGSTAMEDDITEMEQELSEVGELDLEDLAGGLEGEDEAMASLDELDNLDLGDLSAEEEAQELGNGGLDFDLDLGLAETESSLTDSTEDEQDEDTVLDLESLGEDLEGEELVLDMEGATADGDNAESITGDASESEVTNELELPAMDETIGEKLELPVLDFDADESESDADGLELSIGKETNLELGAEIDEMMEESELVASLSEGDAGSNDLMGDEVNTKLDLARAYVDMGDSEGARSILDEVLGEGSEGQKEEAQQLLQALP